jgi:hypothetical protein
MTDYLVGIINDEGNWHEVEYADSLEDGKKRVRRLVAEDRDFHEKRDLPRWKEVFVFNDDVGRRVYRHITAEEE